MKKLLIFELLILTFFADYIKEKNNILILNDNNFKVASKKLNKLFILTYSSHNPKSK